MARHQGTPASYGEIRAGLNFKHEVPDATLSELAERSGLSITFWSLLKNDKASVKVRKLLGDKYELAVKTMNS